MRKIKLYDVYDNNEHIYTGTSEDIATLLNHTIGYIRVIIRKEHKRYRIVEAGYLQQVYALYDNERYIADGTIEQLAELTNESVATMDWRKHSVNKERNNRYQLTKIEGEYSVTVKKRNTKWQQNIFEMIIGGKLYTGTRLEIIKESGIQPRVVNDMTELIGCRYAIIKAEEILSDKKLGAPKFGTREELSEQLKVTPKTFTSGTVARGQVANHKITITDRSTVEYYRAPTKIEKKSPVKPIPRVVQAQPVTPMSDYALELLEWSTRHLREYQR